MSISVRISFKSSFQEHTRVFRPNNARYDADKDLASKKVLRYNKFNLANLRQLEPDTFIFYEDA